MQTTAIPMARFKQFVPRNSLQIDLLAVFQDINYFFLKITAHFSDYVVL